MQIDFLVLILFFFYLTQFGEKKIIARNKTLHQHRKNEIPTIIIRKALYKFGEIHVQCGHVVNNRMNLIENLRTKEHFLIKSNMKVIFMEKTQNSSTSNFL